MESRSSWESGATCGGIVESMKDSKRCELETRKGESDENKICITKSAAKKKKEMEKQRFHHDGEDEESNSGKNFNYEIKDE